MLKRDGENCEHQVPNYPGLLTTSEYKAYQAAIPLVAEQVRLHNERIKLLAELEKRIPEIANQIAGEEFANLATIESWQFRHTLFTTSRSEIILCSRGTKDEEQFGVIERFDPNSPYARVHGNSQEIMRSNNAYLVLQNFVEGERNVLRMYRQDIAGTVDEKLTEMFPGLNNKRVVRAIAARCDSQEKRIQSEQEAPGKSTKIRM
jgi:hypothetical protein